MGDIDGNVQGIAAETTLNVRAFLGKLDHAFVSHDNLSGRSREPDLQKISVSLRCGGLPVNYIRAAFHYLFEPERIPERLYCGAGKFTPARR